MEELDDNILFTFSCVTPSPHEASVCRLEIHAENGLALASAHDYQLYIERHGCMLGVPFPLQLWVIFLPSA